MMASVLQYLIWSCAT